MEYYCTEYCYCTHTVSLLNLKLVALRYSIWSGRRVSIQTIIKFSWTLIPEHHPVTGLASLHTVSD